MTDEELERLKNVEVDFSRVLKAAQEVDPAKVVKREADAKKPAVKRASKPD